MVDAEHDRLSITRQCRLMSIARSSFYYEGTGESPLNLQPDAGDRRAVSWRRRSTASRQMTRWLRRQGDPVSRKRVRRLMRLLGVHGALPAAPDVSAAPGASAIYPYLLTRCADHTSRTTCGCNGTVTYIPLQRGFHVTWSP